MRFLTPRSTRVKAKPVPYKVSTSLSAGYLKPGQQIVFNSQTPFREPDTSRIRLYELDDTNRIRIPFSLTIDTASSCMIRMTASLVQDKTIFLLPILHHSGIFTENNLIQRVINST